MIKIFQGIAKTINFAFKDKKTKDPIDLTGAFISCQIDGSAVFDTTSAISIIGNAILGKAQLNIPASGSTGMVLGRASLDGVVLRTGDDPILFASDVEVVSITNL